jgi:hypothetical protein
VGRLSHAITYDEDERGIAFWARAHGDGVLIVVVGVTTHQGGRENRPQGQGAQVTRYQITGRYA